MKTFKQLREDTSAAVKAFLAKGGKIKKLPPAKAQGYHGKDDPGKDMRGMLDKPDTKKIGTRKKVKSMEANESMVTTSGPFGINPQVGLKVMKKGKEVKPTPPKIGVVSYTRGKKDNPRNKTVTNELSHKKMNQYHRDAEYSKKKATNSAVATILTKGDHSKDLNTMRKRERGMKLAKTRTLKKIRGDK